MSFQFFNQNALTYHNKPLYHTLPHFSKESLNGVDGNKITYRVIVCSWVGC